MKTKYLVSFIIIGFLAVGSAILITKTFAQETTQAADIQYPVKELGNCENQTACRSYCDKPENINACVNFAEKNNMMPKEEIDMAKKFIAAGSTGPGNCKTKDSCETYCNDINNIDACISFAEKNGLMPEKDLAEAKQVQAAIAKGVKPPACGNKKTCDVYCEDMDHMEECITFGQAAGFLQGKELEDAQKILAAIKKGVKPPPCKGKDACDEYCSDPNNMETCMNFAMEAGFMTDEEKANSQKMLSALKKGVKLPACKGKEECDVYCSQDAHFEECTNFAEAAGFMNSEEVAMARKTGGKGPGGCKGKDECEAFCNNPNNQETCFNFGKENGMISEADLKQMEEGKQKTKEALDQAPPAVIDCLNSQLGTEMMEKFKSGAAMPPKEIGDKMRQCFEKIGDQTGPYNQGEPGAGGMIPPAGQTGPGGCKNAEECKTYCESHIEECQKFQPGPGTINPGGQTMPQQAGPGGCKGPDECKAYCESHPDECKNSNSGSGGQFAPGTNSQNPGGQTMPQQAGPGGCKTLDECKSYCETNPEACKNFQTPAIPMPSQNSQGPNNQNLPGSQPPTGPNGCATPEECQRQIMIPPANMCPPEGCPQGPAPIPSAEQTPPQNMMPPAEPNIQNPQNTPPPPPLEQTSSNLFQILYQSLNQFLKGGK